MNLKPREVELQNYQPDFIVTGNHLQFTAGNITLDTSELEQGQVVAQGTAVYEDKETGLYNLVSDVTSIGDMVDNAVLTVHAVRIDSTDVNEQTSGLKAGSVWEDRLHGVTDNFKEAVRNRINFNL